MNRRDFIAGLAATPWPLSVRAQGRKLPLIGFLNNGTENVYGRYVSAFKAGLADAGYQDGRDVVIEYRWAEGRDERLPELADDLIKLGANVLAATGGSVTAQAAKASAKSVSVVFVIGADPRRLGLVESLSRPGGSLTGASFMANELLPKQLAVIHELRKEPRGVAYLINPANPNAEVDARAVVDAAKLLDRPLLAIQATTAEELDRVLASCLAPEIGSLLIFPDALFTIEVERIAAAALRCRLPALYTRREFADAGGLLSYGPDQAESYRQAGIYVGRILAGAKPVDLPVVLPTRFDLVVNLKTARGLGLTMPASLLARADEVIE